MESKEREMRGEGGKLVVLGDSGCWRGFSFPFPFPSLPFKNLCSHYQLTPTTEDGNFTFSCFPHIPVFVGYISFTLSMVRVHSILSFSGDP